MTLDHHRGSSAGAVSGPKERNQDDRRDRIIFHPLYLYYSFSVLRVCDFFFLMFYRLKKKYNAYKQSLFYRIGINSISAIFIITIPFKRFSVHKA